MTKADTSRVPPAIHLGDDEHGMWLAELPTDVAQALEQDGGIRLGAGRVIVEAEMP